MYHLKRHLAAHKVSRSNAHKKTTTQAKEKRELSSASERKYCLGWKDHDTADIAHSQAPPGILLSPWQPVH